MKLKRDPLWFIASILILVSMACSPVVAPTSMPQPVQPTETAQPVASATANAANAVSPTPPPNVYAPAFAAFQPVSVDIPASFNGGDYSLPVDLANVQHLDEIPLSESQQQMLSQNGFVVLPPKPAEFREFYQIYEQGRYTLHPVFVTTDSIYHVYHLLFDKMLRDLERDSFIAILNSLTSSMLNASYQQYGTLKGTALEEPALRNVAFFAVAAQLLGLPDAPPAEVTGLVNAELALINGAGGPEVSPIWDRPDLPASQTHRAGGR